MILSRRTFLKGGAAAVAAMALAAIPRIPRAETHIVIDRRKHVSWEFSTKDLTLSIEEYSERYIKPAMRSLAEHETERYDQANLLQFSVVGRA